MTAANASTNEHGLTIFVSYQRADSPYAAGWLAERIARKRGNWRVILDVDSLHIGEEFLGQLQRELENSHVMVCIIGKDFNSEKLRNEELAGVGNELSIATDLGMPVVPFLVNAASMPADLPQNASWIADRHGMRTDESTFNICVDALIDRLSAREHDLIAARRTRSAKAESQRTAEADGKSELPPKAGSPALLINLGPWVTEPEKELNRSGYGFSEGMSDDALYDSIRGWWRVNQERVKGVKFAVAVHKGITRGLFTIDGPDPASDSDNWAFIGKPVLSGPDFDHFVGPTGKPVARSYGATIRYLISPNATN